MAMVLVASSESARASVSITEEIDFIVEGVVFENT